MTIKLLKKMNSAKILVWIFWLAMVFFTLVAGSADPTSPPPGTM